jgi:sugar/nucleoside kinase (ribokinase family)
MKSGSPESVLLHRVGGGDSFSGGIIHGLLTKATQGEANNTEIHFV